MNVKLQHVISNITGQTGMDIIEAIVGGERDPRQLAQLRNYRIKADEATIAKSLQGHWREEHIFELTQALELYRVYQAKIASATGRLKPSWNGLRTAATANLPPNGKKVRGTRRASMSVCHAGVDLRIARLNRDSRT